MRTTPHRRSLYAPELLEARIAPVELAREIHDARLHPRLILGLGIGLRGRNCHHAFEIEQLAKEVADPVPVDDCELPWPVLGAREWNVEKGLGEIEPGETEMLCSDFSTRLMISRSTVSGDAPG